MAFISPKSCAAIRFSALLFLPIESFQGNLNWMASPCSVAGPSTIPQARFVFSMLWEN